MVVRKVRFLCIFYHNRLFLFFSVSFNFYNELVWFHREVAFHWRILLESWDTTPWLSGILYRFWTKLESGSLMVTQLISTLLGSLGGYNQMLEYDVFCLIFNLYFILRITERRALLSGIGSSFGVATFFTLKRTC